MMMNTDCEALLLDYAAGSLDEAHTLLVASYLTLSPEGRRFVSTCEALGGAMIEHLCEPAPLSAGCLEAVLQKIDCSSTKDCAAIEECIQSFIECCDPIPRPLTRLIAAGPRPSWKKILDGLEYFALPFESCPSQAQIFRCAPAFTMPHHEHEGSEITLVLHGALEDQDRRYVRGNILHMAHETRHAPFADRDTGCICLVVTAAPPPFLP